MMEVGLGGLDRSIEAPSLSFPLLSPQGTGCASRILQHSAQCTTPVPLLTANKWDSCTGQSRFPLSWFAFRSSISRQHPSDLPRFSLLVRIHHAASVVITPFYI